MMWESKTFSGSTRPCRKVELYSCRCSATRNIGSKAISKNGFLDRWCFCGFGQEKYGIKRARTNQTGHGIVLPGQWHRHQKKLHIRYFIGLNHSWIEISSPRKRKASRLFTFRVRPTQDNDYSYYFCTQSVVHWRRGVWLVSSVSSKSRSSSSWRSGTVNRRPHELDTPKRCNSFGKPNARQRGQQILSSSVTRSCFFSISWKRPIFVTRLSMKN